MSQTHKALRGAGLVSNRSFAENSAFVSPTATVDEDSYLGHGSFIGANTTIGKRVLICNLVRVGDNVTVGDDVTIECGNVIPDGTVIPPGSVLLDPCCSTPPIPPEGAMLQFDSVNAVGTRLALFDTTGFTKGTPAYVGNDSFADLNSLHDFFTLVYGENLPVPTYGFDVVNSPTFGVDGAQWRRNGVIDQQAITKVFWSVDPTNSSGAASDECTGWGATQAAADLHPLRSMQALNQRLRGYNADLPLVIHLMSPPDSTTYQTLTSLSTFEGSLNFVTIVGDRIPVNGTALGRTVTAHQVAVPATNIERSITVDGADDVAAFVNMMVQTADGGKTAFVTRKLAANKLAISQARSSDAMTADAGAVIDFADGDVLNFYNLTKLCDYPFPPTGTPYPLLAWFRLDADGSNRAPVGEVGNWFPTFIQCIFGDVTKNGIISCNLHCEGNQYVETISCQMSGQHGNDFSGGDWFHQSLSVLVGFDGPQVHSSNWEFHDELNITATSGGPAFRQLAGGPFNVFISGDGAGNRIATFGLTLTAAFDLWQPNHAPSGSFVVRPNNTGPNLFAWYGVVGGGIPKLRLLTLGVGTKSQLPFNPALITVDTSGEKPISIDNVEFDFADVPINTLSGSTLSD